jgi:hypothetical protein
MTNEELLREINSLPPEGQRLIESFLAFLRQRYAASVASSSNTLLQDEKFVGMWRDREELTDSTAWVRGLRETEWGQ